MTDPDPIEQQRQRLAEFATTFADELQQLRCESEQLRAALTARQTRLSEIRCLQSRALNIHNEFPRVLVALDNIQWLPAATPWDQAAVRMLYTEVLRGLESGTRNLGAEMALHAHRQRTYAGMLISGLGYL